MPTARTRTAIEAWKATRVREVTPSHRAPWNTIGTSILEELCASTVRVTVIVTLGHDYIANVA